MLDLMHPMSPTGFPSPRVTWSRNGRPVDATFSQLANGTVRNEVVFRGVDRSFLHDELTCAASNTNLTRPVSVTVHVDMNFAPVYVAIEKGAGDETGEADPRRRLVAGQPAEIRCVTAGSRPPPVITWHLDGERIEGASEEVRVPNQSKVRSGGTSACKCAAAIEQLAH